ncbi:hypothetical protein NDU88_008368 [Pleurodeles waltl]|uniref:Uncharacterized protein n=1 Tax=Pleurodeles waltl TaxID=8319 RepID=A0AAV7NXL9_PLEWA|nr:hypothetical protein NDU88_008368 [Pleurodeles waltl]
MEGRPWAGLPRNTQWGARVPAPDPHESRPGRSSSSGGATAPACLSPAAGSTAPPGLLLREPLTPESPRPSLATARAVGAPHLPPWGLIRRSGGCPSALKDRYLLHFRFAVCAPGVYLSCRSRGAALSGRISCLVVTLRVDTGGCWEGSVLKVSVLAVSPACVVTPVIAPQTVKRPVRL